MSGIARRATTLLREMLSQDGGVSLYNEEVIRVTLQQIEQCKRDIDEIAAQARAAAARQQPEGEEPAPFEWSSQPERFAAVIIQHETIIKLKRILLTYMKMRADTLRTLRWEERHLPVDVRDNLSPAEIEEYDRVLSKYMGAATGVGMDLTLDLAPPRDAAVRVRVLKDHGALSTSGSARVDLVKGSVHNMQRGEAEHLIRMGVLAPLDNY